jgi:hypothetical protein
MGKYVGAAFREWVEDQAKLGVVGLEAYAKRMLAALSERGTVSLVARSHTQDSGSSV